MVCTSYTVDVIEMAIATNTKGSVNVYGRGKVLSRTVRFQTFTNQSGKVIEGTVDAKDSHDSRSTEGFASGKR